MVHKFVLLVANQPSPLNEAEYNEWYNLKHIPLMFAYPGMKKAARYRRLGDNPEASPYLAVYEFDSESELQDFTHSPQFAAAVRDFDEKWRDGGFERKWGASYELIQIWEK
jgi:hypothetical protein